MLDHDTRTLGAEGDLSRAQLRLWFLSRLRPHDPAYTLITAIRIEGPVNPHALAAAAADVLRDHPILLSVFGIDDGSPFQRSDPTAVPPMALVDLSGLLSGPESPHGPHVLRSVLDDLAARPIDLVGGPVTRWWLIRLGDQQHVLALVVHHIVFDGGSLEPVGAGLSAGYGAHTAGRPLPRSGPDADRSTGAGADRREGSSADFWTRTLAGAPARLTVLPRRGAEAVDDERHSACTVGVALGQDRVAALTELASAARCTPFIVLLTIFGGLVARYSGQQDVVVGTPVSLREEGDPPVGLSLNMVPLRLDLSGSPSLQTALRRTRDVVLDAFGHRGHEFESTVESLAPGRDLDHPPIFQVVFAHQASPSAPALRGLRTQVLPVDPAAAKYPLTVVATETGGDVELSVQADLGATDRDAVQLFAANLDLMISGALARPHQAMSALPVLGAIDGAARSGAGETDGDTPVLGNRADPQHARGRRPPSPGLEQRISALWLDVLGIPGVDAERTFFEQGGSSLTLLRLHAALTRSVAPGLNLVDLFRHPSIERLALHLGAQVPGPATSSARKSPAPDAADRGVRRRQRIARQKHG